MTVFATSTARTALLLAMLLGCAWQAAHSEIRVDIEGVDADLRRNIAALLSVERYKDRERIEPDAVERLYRRVDDEVRSALRPFGYYEPNVTSSLETLQKDRNWRVNIAIELGTPVLIDQVSVVVRGPGATDPNFTRITQNPVTRSGERLEHPAYERIKGDLQRTAITYGYLDARMLRSDLLVDPTAHKASIFLELETGERYRFGATTIEQNAIRESQMRRFLRYSEGEPYDATKWLRTQFALDDSQYFATLEVTPGERDTVTHIVPMSIKATPARRTYPFAIGYGTDTGPRATISYFNPRVNSLGHRLRMQLQGSEIKKAFDARYDVPIGDPALEKMSLNFTAEDLKITDTLDTTTVSLKPSITHVVGRWQRILSVNAIHTASREDQVDGTTLRSVDNLIVPGITYASVPEGYLGESLFSRTLYAELLGSHSMLGANVNFIRLDVQGERVLDLAPRWHLLLRGEVGASHIGRKSEVQEIPAQYQFFAGGDRSVRGFAYNELSPFEIQPDANGQPSKVSHGGRHLITGTVELERDLPRNFGIAAFFDFGNAIDRFGDPLAYSAGLGFRWRLPGVTLGIDVAKSIQAPGFGDYPLQRLPGPRLHLNISPRL